MIAPTKIKRYIFFVLSDLVLISLSLYFSFLLRFEFSIGARYSEIMIAAWPMFAVVKLLSFAGFRLYKITWKYVGIRDLWNVCGAVMLSETALMVVILVQPTASFHIQPLYNMVGFPRSIFIIDGIISLILISAVRISKRIFLEVVQQKRGGREGKRTVIIGAGHTGEMIMRDITRQSNPEFYPVGILDDDSNKLGTYMHGVRIMGTTGEIKDIIRKLDAEAVIIAIPSLNYKLLRRIYDSARELNIRSIKVIQRIYDFNKPDIGLKKLEEIRIEDLIGRQSVEVDYKGIEAFLAGKSVLVTGAGGSIGSEIVTQLCSFGPGMIILFDIDETDLHNMEMKLKKLFPLSEGCLRFVVGDIRDNKLIGEVFLTFKPEVVFHAAAYKHVPMMEHNPVEAAKVNILGTYNVVRAAMECGVGKFIMISTDKAVRPSSVMGATKRVAEYICRAFNDGGSTEFVSIRFGNVLGSRGSVLPLFLEQLKDGGPITVTHPEIQRYFMTIPEAVSLVLQASVIGKGGDIMVLDMGEQVKIVRLAEELIKLHGLEPYRDIDIQFIGLRPGEKLYEELFTGEEETLKTKHKKVFIANNMDNHSLQDINAMVKEFDAAIDGISKDNAEVIRALLTKYVKHFPAGN